METTKIKLPEWKITKLDTRDGVRWVIQRLRTDASKPYYLTQRIYRFKSTAEREFEGVIVEITAKEHNKWKSSPK
jgi:hypothetical protein